MKVVNKTAWDTRVLRSILTRVAKEEFERNPAKVATLVVNIVYRRGRGAGVTGLAYLGGHTSYLRVPRPDRCRRNVLRADGVWVVRQDFPARDFAITAAHEFGHNAGIPHRNMKLHHQCYTRYAREHLAWADAITVPLKQAPAKPTVAAKRAKALAAAQQHVKQCERKAKLASTLLKKWRQRVRELERRIAASPAPQREEVTGHAGSDGMASEVSQ